jgi:hypothetical protein
LGFCGVVALATAGAPAGAPADEVTVVLAGGGCVSTLHYSANCAANRRNIVLEGSDGRISIDVLADAALLTRRRDSRWRRALGPALLAPVIGAVRALPDRVGFLMDRLRGDNPHARLIAAFAGHLQGNGASPTPLAEIDYAVRNCERIGREIDRRLEETRAAS